ncbi:glutamate-1-semialdehyde 2,1-aminomutase [Brevibacillus centrosporus]|uniref:glutamate-1-semialdehyde 2,1-aminomutase n=1 Tax=Brevibacillus centrosporus TaxID=54910 RepID=UPI00381FB811
MDQRFLQSRLLQEKAHKLIPAGCHTYSKGDDQFPELSPAFIRSGKGAWVQDVDGNTFLDWGMGLRSVSLGHGYDRIVKKVIEYVQLGSNFTRPAPIETELAERLLDLIPSAEMVKYAKNGSDVTSAAVRLSRAYTGRKRVAVCKEHPFFSFHDWFIGTTPCNNGIPDEITELTLSFHYNDIQSLLDLYDRYPGEIAAVIMEPVTTQEPHESFLQQVRQITKKEGSVLIFDEMITGFRYGLPGAQSRFGVEPDLSAFGKAIGNGFSCAVLAGKREIMELGGLHHHNPRVFLLSGTHGAETHSLAAVNETIQEYREKDVVGHMQRMGSLLVGRWNDTVRKCKLEDYLVIGGYPCSPIVTCFDGDKRPSAWFRTLFLQEMVRNGVLIPYISISYSHREKEVDFTIEALEKACLIYQKALEGDVQKWVSGPPVKPVFRKFN